MCPSHFPTASSTFAAITYIEEDKGSHEQQPIKSRYRHTPNYPCTTSQSTPKLWRPLRKAAEPWKQAAGQAPNQNFTRNHASSTPAQTGNLRPLMRDQCCTPRTAPFIGVGRGCPARTKAPSYGRVLPRNRSSVIRGLEPRRKVLEVGALHRNLTTTATCTRTRDTCHRPPPRSESRTTDMTAANTRRTPDTSIPAAEQDGQHPESVVQLPRRMS